jgi:hypothetical protein
VRIEQNQFGHLFLVDGDMTLVAKTDHVFRVLAAILIAHPILPDFVRLKPFRAQLFDDVDRWHERIAVAATSVGRAG